MAIDGLTPAIVFPIFNFVLRSVQTAYEIATVPAETSDYLKTISHVLTDLNTAKQLRRQKAEFMTREELSVVDNAILNTENAMQGVELLVERARVDMSISPGSVSAGSRIMWVVRDQHKIGAAMNRLSIVSQSLHREIITMRGAQSSGFKYDYGSEKYDYGHDVLKNPWEDAPCSSVDAIWQPAPPTYLQATIDAMHQRRVWNERRNSLVKRGPTSRNVTPTSGTVPTATFPASTDHFNDSELMSATMNSIADWIKHNEDMLSVLAPSTSAAPRDTFLPATIVNMVNDIDDQDTIAELIGDIPLPTMQPPLASPPHIRPTTAPQLPTTSLYHMTLQNLRDLDLTLSTPDPDSKPRATHRPSKPRSKPPPPPSQYHQLLPSVSVSNHMESTTLIPGHRKPVLLRWKEDTGEEIHTVESYADAREATHNHDDHDNGHHASIPQNPFNDNHEPQIDLFNHDETEDENDVPLRRVPTRRRPPQIHGEVSPISAGSVVDIPQTVHVDSQHRPRGRGVSSSAQSWRIERQKAELARLGS